MSRASSGQGNAQPMRLGTGRRGADAAHGAPVLSVGVGSAIEEEVGDVGSRANFRIAPWAGDATPSDRTRGLV
eukprot:2451560-Alexandrium_andersonii.AAC.1